MTTLTNIDLNNSFISKCEEAYKKVKKDEIKYIYELGDEITTTTKEEQLTVIISSIENIREMFDKLFETNNSNLCML